MDVVLLGYIALLLVVLIIVITFFSKRSSKKDEGDVAVLDSSRQRVLSPVTLRGVRQRRYRPQINNDEDCDDEMAIDSKNESVPLKKLGAKKRAKLEAKAERKNQREIEEQERKLMKEQQLLIEQQRDKEQQDELEEKRLEMLLQQKKAEEEENKYLMLKKAFSVEEEGYDEKEDVNSVNLLEEFVQYVKRNKVVILEDLGQRFGLNTVSVIKRVQQMQADGTLSGVIDDRGKFIYVSEQELEAVAKFVKQRGRVSITELAEHSNNLINLEPENLHGTVEA